MPEQQVKECFTVISLDHDFGDGDNCILCGICGVVDVLNILAYHHQCTTCGNVGPIHD